MTMPVAVSIPVFTAPATGTSTTTTNQGLRSANTTARTKISAPSSVPLRAEASWASTPAKPAQGTHAGRKPGAGPCCHPPAVTRVGPDAPRATPGWGHRDGGTGTTAREMPGNSARVASARRSSASRIAGAPSRDSISMAAMRATDIASSARSVSDERMRNELRLANSSSPDNAKNVTIRIAGTTPMNRYEMISLRRTRQRSWVLARRATRTSRMPAPITRAMPPSVLRPCTPLAPPNPADDNPSVPALSAAPATISQPARLPKQKRRAAVNHPRKRSEPASPGIAVCVMRVAWMIAQPAVHSRTHARYASPPSATGSTSSSGTS